MDPLNPHEAVFPCRVTSPSGLSVEILSNGAIRRIDHGDIMLNLFPGSEMEGGPINLHLRAHGDGIRSHGLLGPGSGSVVTVCEDGFSACGEWNGLVYQVRFVMARSHPAWFWHVEIRNTTHQEVSVDLIHTHDLGLAHYGAIRLNEYYVSQYIDHTPLQHGGAGWVVASRQNQSMGGRFPWTMIGSLGRAVSFATDALQFHGLSTRSGDEAAGLAGGLEGARLQHEHSMACLQDEPVKLAPGAGARLGFFGGFKPDQPRATEGADVEWADVLLALPEAAPAEWKEGGAHAATGSLFSDGVFLESLPLGDGEVASFFGEAARHEEREDSRLWSFFGEGGKHVVMKAKEVSVLRPHGTILRSGGVLTADESALTSTCWMNGVFHSMITQGHVSINRFLSTCHSYLGMFRSHGQRVFAGIDGKWRLMDMPSAFEMTPDRCRWIYKHAGGVIEVIAEAPADRHELKLVIRVLSGEATGFLISHHVAMNGDDGNVPHPVIREERDGGVFIRAIADSDVGRRFPDGGFLIKPAAGTSFSGIGGDELLFHDGRTRRQPYLCMRIEPAVEVGLSVEGKLVDGIQNHDARFWEEITGGLRVHGPDSSELAAAVERLEDFFPWLVQNALVHYLSPRGLEQYSGGGWGTRDVCQGPVELLLGLGRPEPVRNLLLRVFRQQNPDGDWPQWFMFFDRERNIRPGDSHGDIVYWPLLALAEYLSATGDASILGERVPYFHQDEAGMSGQETILQHVECAVELILGRVIAGTNLAAYGHGDWNDSLQPAKPDMRERLCSSWTVTLNYQTFVAMASAFRLIGDAQKAAQFEAMAGNVLEEFQRLLVVDDVVAGLAYFHEGGRTDWMLHPRDEVTGLSYSLLPMIHAVINDMFTPRQAEHHLAVIRKHLSGPDGARLFDKPMAYHGGIQTNFQRAESASFFGREIGIMYTHAHLRWCEALARFGDAEAFFKGLRQFTPILPRDVIPSARPRQANCYYSSSDAVFADRYEAFAKYDGVMSGEVPLEGGWRVYSSGAGIGVRLIMQCFIGLRLEATSLVLDPVVPKVLDGLKVELVIEGRKVRILYQIDTRGCGPVSVNLNGEDLDFIREYNPYRTGGVRIALDRFKRGLVEDLNHLTVWLG